MVMLFISVVVGLSFDECIKWWILAGLHGDMAGDSSWFAHIAAETISCGNYQVNAQDKNA